MRVAVTGATGNVGTSLLPLLAADPDVDSVVGIARRRPRLHLAKVDWREADVRDADLGALFADADAVVHLAWLIQPSHNRATLRAVNVDGSKRVFEAAAAAGVRALVYASSVGAYSPGPKDRAVDESWSTDGIETSYYGQDKAAVERVLDEFERARPDVRVVRLRPALCFKREAASGIRRLFAGPFVPAAAFNPRLVPIVPALPGLRFQAVHSDDVGAAYHLAIKRRVSGAFNIAADPVLDPERLGAALGARPVAVSPRAVRALVGAGWRARLVPSSPGWLDMALSVPVMDTGRAREELGWKARHDAVAALLELLAGIRRGAGAATPPLDPQTSGPLRVRELLTGVGGRSV